MELSDRSKILILIVLVGIVLYLLFSNKSPTRNEGMLTQDIYIDPKTSNLIEQDQNDLNTILENLDQDTQSNNISNENSSNENVKDDKKITAKYTGEPNEHKRVNYSDGKRNAKSDSLDKFFEGKNPINNNNTNDGFVPVDDNKKYAAYLSSKTNGKKLNDKDKFNPISLLPNEDDNDAEWFDNPYKSNAVSVKSKHLINVSRPIGVNTIGQSLKNANLQLRPDPANPKVPVSPWSNSSIEPDNNIRSMCI